jgi:hypothetical protein
MQAVRRWFIFENSFFRRDAAALVAGKDSRSHETPQLIHQQIAS